MGLLETLKSLLGLEDDERRDAATDDRDVGITVEREGERRHAADDPTTAEAETATEPGGGSATASASSSGGVSASASTADADAEAAPTTPSGTAADAATDADEDRVPSEAVDVVKGIGPTYAGRLSDAGIDTVADLAEADASAIAAAADVPESRVADWIERARDRTR